MKVVKQWYDATCEDGFPNIFAMDDGTTVFTSEKRQVWRDESGDVLDTAYKSGFREHPEVNRALDEVSAKVPVVPFDDDMRALWERCIEDN